MRADSPEKIRVLTTQQDTSEQEEYEGTDEEPCALPSSLKKEVLSSILKKQNDKREEKSAKKLKFDFGTDSDSTIKQIQDPKILHEIILDLAKTNAQLKDKVDHYESQMQIYRTMIALNKQDAKILSEISDLKAQSSKTQETVDQNLRGILCVLQSHFKQQGNSQGRSGSPEAIKPEMMRLQSEVAGMMMVEQKAHDYSRRQSLLSLNNMEMPKNQPMIANSNPELAAALPLSGAQFEIQQRLLNALNAGGGQGNIATTMGQQHELNEVVTERSMHTLPRLLTNLVLDRIGKNRHI